MSYTIPLGTKQLTIALPWPAVDVATPPATPVPLLDVAEQVRTFALKLLAEQPATRPIVIAFTDATRASPDQQLLEPLLRILLAHQRAVTLICAVGMHRPSTGSEKRAKLGDWIVDNATVIDHDRHQVRHVGDIDGMPIEINPLLLDAVVISVGVVEPHQYAGYSGGFKTTVIGCGGADTIAATHGPTLLNAPGTRLANMDSNPFQAFVRRAGRLIDHDYAINVICGHDGQIVAFAAGQPAVVHDFLVKQARDVFEVPVPNAPYDVVIAGVGAPKDANLYQASRAATYIGLSANPVLRPGGLILLVADMREGAGNGLGERHTFDILQRFGPTQALMNHMLENGFAPGQQRAYVIAKLCQYYRLMVVGASRGDVVRAAGLAYAPSIDAAVRMVDVVDPHVLVVPHAIKMLPVRADSR